MLSDAVGMPNGMRIFGKQFAENCLLGIASAYQEATDFHLRAPHFEQCEIEEICR